MPETWVVAHLCPHCRYSHMVALEHDAEREGHYIYRCPITRKESRFGFNDSTAVRTPRGPVTGSVPGRDAGRDSGD